MSPADDALRVLFVTLCEPWPLDHGGRLHVHHVVAGLAAHARVHLALPHLPTPPSHVPAGVEVIAFGDDAAAGEEPHESWAARATAAHFGARPGLARWLVDHATPDAYDVVVLHGPTLGRFVDCCRTPVVWNAQDELLLAHGREMRRAGPLAWPRLVRAAALYAAYERGALRRAAATIYVSPVDAAVAGRLAPSARIETIANGVVIPPAPTPIPATDEPEIVFVGRLDFPPNIDAVRWFAAHVWPRVLAAAPKCRFRIAGRSPGRAVLDLAHAPGVVISPDVPDVGALLDRAAAVVCPVRTGGGLKNKVLEACAARRPLIASPPSLAGLSARIGRDVLAAASVREWVAGVGRLLTDRPFAQRVADAGRAWVQRAHCWERTAEQFTRLLASVARRVDAGGPTRAVHLNTTPVARLASEGASCR